ncbi:hypothetical protein L210DRAFT_3514069, partial [Boletus edulis BED1]
MAKKISELTLAQAEHRRAVDRARQRRYRTNLDAKGRKAYRSRQVGYQKRYIKRRIGTMDDRDESGSSHHDDPTSDVEEKEEQGEQEDDQPAAGPSRILRQQVFIEILRPRGHPKRRIVESPDEEEEQPVPKSRRKCTRRILLSDDNESDDVLSEYNIVNPDNEVWDTHAEDGQIYLDQEIDQDIDRCDLDVNQDADPSHDLRTCSQDEDEDEEVDQLDEDDQPYQDTVDAAKGDNNYGDESHQQCFVGNMMIPHIAIFGQGDDGGRDYCETIIDKGKGRVKELQSRKPLESVPGPSHSQNSDIGLQAQGESAGSRPRPQLVPVASPTAAFTSAVCSPGDSPAPASIENDLVTGVLGVQ